MTDLCASSGSLEVPLSDQASVELECEEWSKLWLVDEEHPQLDFPDDHGSNQQLEALMPWAS